MNRTILLILTLLTFWAAAYAVTESEPNDDPTANDYAGGLGALGATPLVVDGIVATYETNEMGQIIGDNDFHRFTLNETTHISARMGGFSGGPFLFILDADLAVKATGTLRDGEIRVPATSLSPGTYYAIVAGAAGPDNDPYSLTIQRVADAGLAIQKATVKFNIKKPEQDSAKVVAQFAAETIDPATDGLTMTFLSRTWLIEPGRFVAKGSKFIYKGAKGELLKKMVIDPAKSKLSLTLKKGELGEPRDGEVPDTSIRLKIESGAHLMDQSVNAVAKKDGRVLSFK